MHVAYTGMHKNVRQRHSKHIQCTCSAHGTYLNCIRYMPKTLQASRKFLSKLKKSFEPKGTWNAHQPTKHACNMFCNVSPTCYWRMLNFTFLWTHPERVWFICLCVTAILRRIIQSKINIYLACHSHSMYCMWKKTLYRKDAKLLWFRKNTTTNIWAVSWENQHSAYAKTKAQNSFAVTAKLINAFVFATWIEQFLYFLNPRFPVPSHLLCLYRPVCIGPVGIPHHWFSHDMAPL